MRMEQSHGMVAGKIESLSLDQQEGDRAYTRGMAGDF